MSEVPLYMLWYPAICAQVSDPSYRGTSPIGLCTLLGPYIRTMPMALWLP
jgi:hypothetical protein